MEMPNLDFSLIQIELYVHDLSINAINQKLLKYVGNSSLVKCWIWFNKNCILFDDLSID